MSTIRTDVPLNENTVIEHSNYIEVIWDGPQDAAKVQKSNLEAMAAAEKLKAAGTPIRLSIFIQNHPHTPNMGAFKEALKIFNAVEFERLSISGTVPSMVLSLITTTISSFSSQLEIKYFPDQQEALTWLLRDKPTAE